MRSTRFVLLLSSLLIAFLLISACRTSSNAYDDAQAALTQESSVTETSAPPTEDPVIIPVLSQPDPNFYNQVGECRVKTNPVFDYPLVSENDWKIGAENPAVTIIIYSDLQCPYCAMMDPILMELFNAHPDETLMVFRHFPLDYHPLAAIGAAAAEVVGEELGDESFFEFISLLFAQQAEWNSLEMDAFISYLQDVAVNEFNLNADEFAARLQKDEIQQLVSDDYQSGIPFIDGTPFVLMNGIPLRYFPSFVTSFEDAFQFAKAYSTLVYTECPKMTIDVEKQYFATFNTSKGSFVVELYPKSAPFTVNSFLFLVQDGFFNNSPFHRVIPGFVAQGGTGATGELGPGYEFDNEIDPNLSYDKMGVVGMANRGADTNTSQFFITYDPQTMLDGGYTIFGQVIEGMEVVQALQPVNPQTDQSPVTPDFIISISIEVK